MNTNVTNKPRALRVLAWAWIGWGSFLTFSGLRDVSRNMAHAAAAAEAGIPLAQSDMYVVIQGMAALIAALGIVGIAGSIGLLQLRAWGRSTLVAANWGMLGILAWFGLQWQAIAFRAATSHVHYVRDSSFWETAQPIVLGLLVCGLAAAPFVWALRKLSDRIVVDAIGRAAAARFNRSAASA